MSENQNVNQVESQTERDVKNAVLAVQMYEVCPVCLDKVRGPILISPRNTEAYRRVFANLEEHVMGNAPEPCEACWEKMEKGIIVIGMKGEPKGGEKPERSGHMGFIHEDLLGEVIGKGENSEGDFSKRMILMNYEDGLKVGIFKPMNEGEKTMCEEFKKEAETCAEEVKKPGVTD